MEQQGSTLITRYPNERNSIYSRLGYTESMSDKTIDLEQCYTRREAVYEVRDFQSMIFMSEESDSDVEIIASHVWLEVKQLPKGFKYLAGQRIKYGEFNPCVFYKLRIFWSPNVLITILRHCHQLFSSL